MKEQEPQVIYVVRSGGGRDVISKVASFGCLIALLMFVVAVLSLGVSK